MAIRALPVDGVLHMCVMGVSPLPFVWIMMASDRPP